MKKITSEMGAGSKILETKQKHSTLRRVGSSRHGPQRGIHHSLCLYRMRRSVDYNLKYCEVSYGLTSEQEEQE